VLTPARISVLELLASQAAISLEYARLYNDLLEREARIRRLVDANIIGIFIWDLDGRIIDANEAFLRLVGYDHDDLPCYQERRKAVYLADPEHLKPKKPLLSAPVLRELLSGEKVDEIRVDGVPVPRPVTPWSKDWKEKAATVPDSRGPVVRP
jgi:PAS domain-containing protein